MPPHFITPALGVLAAQAADLRFNSSTLALLGAFLAAIRRKRAIGGWLLYFFCQVLLGLALIISTTHWKLYLSRAWSDPVRYFLFTLSSLPRVALLSAIAVISMELFHTREWHWVYGLRLALLTYLFLDAMKLLVDISYFPDNARLDTLSLAFPSVWIVYFSVSRRVRCVFLEKNWVE
jgi:hypothetical protein